MTDIRRIITKSIDQFLANVKRDIDAIDVSEFATGWRPISSAPMDGSCVQTYWHGLYRHSVVPAYFDIQDQVWRDAIQEYTWGDGPTHWQPLPSPPTEATAS